MTCCAGPLPAALAHDSARQSDLLHLEEMKHAAREMADGSYLLQLNVPEVHCVACISAIERGLAKAVGVKSARVNLTLRQLNVALASPDAVGVVSQTLDDLGYRHSPSSDVKGSDPELKPLLRALAVAGFAAANVMLLSVSVWNGAEQATRDLFHFVSAIIALPAVAYAGQPFFTSAINALRHRRMNMDVPISLGVLLASAMSLYESVSGGGHAYFDAAVSLLFFLLIGRVLDVAMRGRARHLVTRMSALSAKGGMHLLADGSLAYVTKDDIVPGMALRIAAGERLPADAVVTGGTSVVDRSLVTGENEPLAVSSGMALEAGVMNLSSPIDVVASRSAEKSFVGEVTQMLAAAEEGRGHYVRLADRMARIYSPAVHILALLTFAGWMIAGGGNWHSALTTAVAVLIITCPCALGLAVPVAHVVAASSLFKRGILVKEGSALERLSEINHVAFDKTGTLTDNRLHVSLCQIDAHVSVAKALALASSHPAARALAQHLDAVAPAQLVGATELSGLGIETQYEGARYRLGRSNWVAEISANCSDDGLRTSGLAFAREGEAYQNVHFSEDLRVGAEDAIAHMKRCGIGTEMLSGDRMEAVQDVARRLQLEHFSSAMTPVEKVQRLQVLANERLKVLMVGDGLNDAPALAAAHVSMAPSSASDIGRTAADFVFMGENLAAVAEAHSMAMRARRIVLQNFALAAIYNAFAVPLAMAGYLNPLLAAIAMSSSSLLVIGNSLRLGDWRFAGRPHFVVPTRKATVSPA